MQGSACWIILLGYFFFFFFNPGAGSFSVTKLLGHLFFYPTAEMSLSDETTQLLSYSQNSCFLRPLRHRRWFGALQWNKGLHRPFSWVNDEWWF